MAHPDRGIENGLARKLGSVRTPDSSVNIIRDLRHKLNDMNVMLQQLELRLSDFEALDATGEERTLSQ
jgi:hypothetical protein